MYARGYPVSSKPLETTSQGLVSTYVETLNILLILWALRLLVNLQSPYKKNEDIYREPSNQGGLIGRQLIF